MESAIGFLGSIFAEESSLARAKHVRWTVEFGGKRLRIRRLRQQRDRCWPLVGHKIIVLCQITDKPSNKSWNWFVKSSIPEALSPVLENFCRSFSWLNWPTLGLRGCFYQSNKWKNFLQVPTNIFLTVHVELLVHFSNVAVVHMGFHSKERQPEQPNKSSC